MIAAVKGVAPDFVFMAEVYWDMEFTMHQLVRGASSRTCCRPTRHDLDLVAHANAITFGYRALTTRTTSGYTTALKLTTQKA